jgi:hypothetical protein
MTAGVQKAAMTKMTTRKRRKKRQRNNPPIALI